MVVVNFSPTQDMVQVVLDQWVDVFAYRIGRIDERLDTPRIEKAFRIAKGTFSTWPAPSQILDLMPRRPEAQRIGYAPVPTQTAKSYFDICYKVIEGEITQKEANVLFSEIEDPADEVPF